MPTSGKRYLLGGRGKGYLSAAGPQSRFIAFLLVVLFAYTLLLKVFQKLAEVVQLPVFLPISLITLLIFIGMVGMLYSHRFFGPLLRIRRILERMAEGDHTVSMRLRESDDPLLKELASAIIMMSEHNRSTHALVREGAAELHAAITALRETVHRGSDRAAVMKQIDEVFDKQGRLELAVKSMVKS